MRVAIWGRMRIHWVKAACTSGIDAFLANCASTSGRKTCSKVPSVGGRVMSCSKRESPANEEAGDSVSDDGAAAAAFVADEVPAVDVEDIAGVDEEAAVEGGVCPDTVPGDDDADPPGDVDELMVCGRRVMTPLGDICTRKLTVSPATKRKVATSSRGNSNTRAMFCDCSCCSCSCKAPERDSTVA